MKFVLPLAMACVIGNAQAGDLPRIFMTSVTGSGDLSTWPDAHGLSGLEAADEICRTRAAAGSIADASDYVAFLSDAANDAYCRVHGLGGRYLVNACSLSPAAAPDDAGPWYRMDGLAAMDVARNSLVFPPLGGYVPRHIMYDEFGQPIPRTLIGMRAFTATMPNGVLVNPGETCSDWTSTDGESTTGAAYVGYGGSWAGGRGMCSTVSRLICLAKGAHGDALPRPRAPTARLVFVTSSSGTGNLSSWADAGSATGIAAGDAICRAHAERENLPRSATFKAWLSSGQTGALQRLEFDGPFHRLDGVRVVSSRAALGQGHIDAPIQMDEQGSPTTNDFVWTGTLFNGASTSIDCQQWNSTSVGGNVGSSGWADQDWTFGRTSPIGCANIARLYCLGDNDSLFLESFDR
ncbi:hypothetical protein ACQQ2N_17970 [Dokdonella sp. MW10]|uniref:hypothetical protein n=1 Tax=Dokdonella sp. MW10 TaxID=2992926 RepID=UPI003F7EF394